MSHRFDLERCDGPRMFGDNVLSMPWTAGKGIVRNRPGLVHGLRHLRLGLPIEYDWEVTNNLTGGAE